MAVGSGIAGDASPGPPVRGLFSIRRSEKGSNLAPAGGLEAALRQYRLELVGRWPEAAELLVAGVSIRPCGASTRR